MKMYLFLLLSGILTTIVEAQNIDTNKYIRIEDSGSWVLKTDSSKYLRWDGHTVFDIREATKKQLEILILREKLKSLKRDRFLFSVGQALRSKHAVPAVRFEKNTNAKVFRGRHWIDEGALYESILIDGKSFVEIADMLVTPTTAQNYRYRILMNNAKELIGWSVPSDFRKTSDGRYTFAYLGKIAYHPGQFIKVEIYNIKNYSDRNALSIDWRAAKRSDQIAFLQYRRNGDETILSIPLNAKRVNVSRSVNFNKTTTKNDIKFHISDSLLRIQFTTSFSPHNYQVILKSNIKNVAQTKNLGEFNGKFDLYKDLWNKPGKYEVLIIPVVQSFEGTKSYLKSKAMTYKFTVLPPLNMPKFFSTKELLSIVTLVAALGGAILIVVVNRLKKNNARQLLKEQQKKEYAKNQLNTIRTQLNPHFMFNALAGIQNLMNKNDTDTANRFLGKFARLTRNVLDINDMISIKQESVLLEDYLQMEQLRFGFRFTIEVNHKLDAENIEIPSMLLQPFAENSIKHGIERTKEGFINICFDKKDSDLILSVQDNGRGYNISEKSTGLGMQLSQNRISLLNDVYEENTFVLDIQSSSEGTTTIIIIKNWL